MLGINQAHLLVENVQLVSEFFKFAVKLIPAIRTKANKLPSVERKS